MKIVNATATLHALPGKVPLLDKPRNEGRRVLFEIETDDGHTGFGMTGGFLAEGVIATVMDHLVPAIKDMDLRRVEAVHDRMWRLINLRGEIGRAHV